MADQPVAVKIVSPTDVLSLQQSCPDVLIIDVRNVDEWDRYHISEALLIPMNSLTSRLSELDPDRETIVVCEHGIRSLSVAKFLVSQAKFSNVGSMSGGMSQWPGPVVSEMES